MDRRESLKLLALSTISGSLLLDACKEKDKKDTKAAVAEGKESGIDRMEEEAAHDKKLQSEKFFNEHEMETIAVLSNIIIPADDVSGSATDAGVPDFIEFIVKDMPQHQVPMRGGLRWLDLQAVKRFGKSFKECSNSQQIQIVDDIAYPEVSYTDANGKQIKKGSVKPGMQQGVRFFSLMRNLTATGFYTSKIGIQDLGYIGNQPNQWNGVPDDVLKQYGIAYSEKELRECVSFT